MVTCPICAREVKEAKINAHLDAGCATFADDEVQAPAPSTPVASFFHSVSAKQRSFNAKGTTTASGKASPVTVLPPRRDPPPLQASPAPKRPFNEEDASQAPLPAEPVPEPHSKRSKGNALAKAAPLAERMRPRTLDEVCGQELVGPQGVLRGLIEQDRVPSMILWGQPGTGKTTIARLIAHTAGTRFVEINSTSTGVAECKKLFAEARSELSLTSRKTIIFCDEIHRFSKSQQDVFLGPVEAGIITLIGATTENPSFKVASALLSRCRTFVLNKLTEENIVTILRRGVAAEGVADDHPLIDDEMLQYLAAFADGDARTALNLLELALDLSRRPTTTKDEIKRSLTKTLVYDRAGDQHYDTISAFHKSIRGSDPDAALYYLARMLTSGENPLYIARRLIVVASEDVGLADNTMLPLATAAYTAAEKIGMPECRINLAHATVAMCLAPKSTRAYRALSKATAAVNEPGIAGLPVPVHLRNAPTRLLKELGHGQEYKYNPDYKNGRVKQEYLPDKIRGRRFLDDRDLGERIDEDLTRMETDNNIEKEDEKETYADGDDSTEEELLGPDG